MPRPSPIAPEEFVKGLTHDILSPLSSIDGFLKLLLDPSAEDPVSPRQARMMVAMDRACTHIVGLVNDISDLCEIESSAGEGERSAVDLRAAARRALDDYAILGSGRRLSLLLEAPEPLPPVMGEEPLIHRFFDSLVRSAGRLIPEEGKVLLRLGTSSNGDSIEGTLAYDGESFPVETWERLLSGTLTGPRPPEGYAVLGAALCRRIAVRHGGALDARPRPGGGNIFRFRFPRNRR